MFSIENFLQQRAPTVLEKPWLATPLKGILKFLLHEKEIQGFEAKYPHLSGLDFVEQVLDYFNFGYSVRDNQRERIPPTGRVVIIANHPIGSLDGLALVKLVSEIRRDVKIVANEMLMTLKPLHPIMLPVNNMTSNTSKGKVNKISEHLNNEGAIIIFPAGEVSRLKFSGVKDSRWRSGFLRLATSAKAPILPVYVDGRNSLPFYLASMIYKPLATLLLVQEMFKQAKKTVTVKIGDIIPFSSHADIPVSKKIKTQLFQKHLYGIAKSSKPIFTTQKSIAHPEHPIELKQELEQHQLLGETPDNKLIYLCTKLEGSSLLREIGRLREISFRAVGEGTGNRRDRDPFDSWYYHLVLWDQKQMEIVGAYRFCDTKKVIKEQGKEGLYTDSLFNYSEQMDEYLEQGLELGRSFVQPKYWGKRSLDYLWFGIGAFLKTTPSTRYLFGPVSISNSMPRSAKDFMIYFYRLYFSSEHTLASSKLPYQFDCHTPEELSTAFTGNDYKQDFTKLKSLLANMGVAIPTLYKQYSELCEPGGVQFADFGIDPDFADCVDGLVMVDTKKLKPKKRRRYLQD